MSEMLSPLTLTLSHWRREERCNAFLPGESVFRLPRRREERCNAFLPGESVYVFPSMGGELLTISPLPRWERIKVRVK